MKTIKPKEKRIFLLAMCSALIFKTAAHLPGLPESVMSFPTSKAIKIIAGLVFILGTALIYRPKNEKPAPSPQKQDS